MRKKATTILFLVTIAMAQHLTAQQVFDDYLQKILSGITDSTTRSVLAQPEAYRYQIIYTHIDRNKKGVPSFTNFHLQVDPALYFNPASMVKMPLAFLSLEKLYELRLYGIDMYTSMRFDSSYERQVAMYTEPSAENGLPSIAHFIKRALLISENDPYNRMYQFVGQQEANRKLIQKGYSSSRITRQFMGYTEEQNRHTNGIEFIDNKGKVLYKRAPQYNTDSFNFPSPILIGNAHINKNDELISSPFDFTKHNNISLEDMRKMLQAVVFPNSVEKRNQFMMSEEDRLFLLQYLSQYPSETNYPKYDSTIFYDSYVKFFFDDSSHKIPPHIRIYNKVGWAYGFMTDVSYVIDTKNNIDYMLAATVYVNSDGIVNDSKYDEETIGFPFFRAIGKAIYEHELNRERKYHPVLQNPVKHYETRDPKDRRASIKHADN